MRVLTIGAGISGLTAARALQAAGHVVTVLDKGRAPGGRVATRRVLNADADHPELASLGFDHGAQYFTARDARFAAEVDAWHAARVARRWTGVLAAFDSEGREPVEDGHTRWVGVPAMSAIAGHLAHGLDVQGGTRVDTLEPAPTSGREPAWLARSERGGSFGPFDAIVVATPPPQAAPLVRDSPVLAPTVGTVRMHACWTALVAFGERVASPFDAAWVASSPLGWIARDRSKPRRGLAETWVLQASALWSDAHLEDGADVVGPFLLNAFADLVRAGLPRPQHLSAHRWRHACAESPLSVGALVDPNRRWVVCGDWCAGNRIEGAFLSGHAAARAVDALAQDVTRG